MTTATVTRPWFEIRNRAPGKASIYIYDQIGGDVGITAAQFVAELNAITAPAIDVFINSPGGDPYVALTMYEALRRHPAKVTTIVDGIAASAASVVMQAGDRRAVGKHSSVMIHEAGGMTIGPADDHAAMSATLDKISDQIADLYAARAGGTRAAWRERMRAESWYDAEEAVAVGLADEITQYMISNSYTTGRIHNLARNHAPTRVPAYTATPASTIDPTTRASLRKWLNIDDAGVDDLARKTEARQKAERMAAASAGIVGSDGLTEGERKMARDLRLDLNNPRTIQNFIKARKRDSQ